MPNAAEYNQFRRLIGDVNASAIDDTTVKSYLNDAVNELTGDFATPLLLFDSMAPIYHNELIYKAAINWWWNRLGELQEKHSMSVGAATQNVGEKWDRAFQMIQSLQAEFDKIQSLQVDITMGNFSRYSKQTLRRIGGIREEDTNA